MLTETSQANLQKLELEIKQIHQNYGFNLKRNLEFIENSHSDSPTQKRKSNMDSMINRSSVHYSQVQIESPKTSDVSEDTISKG